MGHGKPSSIRKPTPAGSWTTSSAPVHANQPKPPNTRRSALTVDQTGTIGAAPGRDMMNSPGRTGHNV